MNIAALTDDFRNAKHHVEDRLWQGAAFENTVRDFFCADEALMRSFVRDCQLSSLQRSFASHSGQGFADVLANFVGDIAKMRKLTKDGKTPYIVANEALFSRIEDSLRMARMMRENGSDVSAMLIEQRIDAEYIPRLREMNDRNRVRGLVMMHELGI